MGAVGLHGAGRGSWHELLLEGTALELFLSLPGISAAEDSLEGLGDAIAKVAQEAHAHRERRLTLALRVSPCCRGSHQGYEEDLEGKSGLALCVYYFQALKSFLFRIYELLQKDFSTVYTHNKRIRRLRMHIV